MKNQYFGDVRDLFKYDLIEFFLKERSLSEFAFIAMRTENTNKKEGNKRDFLLAAKNCRPGTKNEKLMEFLMLYNCKKTEPSERDIRDVVKYFEPKGIEVRIHDTLFKHDSRRGYFEQLKSPTMGILSSPLILVDPDIGLQVGTSSEKHLLYDDVKGLYYKNMKRDSILMIFQYLPHDRSILEYLPSGRANTLKENLGLGYPPLYISDNEICFLFLTQDDNLRKELVKILSKYIKEYEEFFSRLSISNIYSESI